VTLPVTGTYTVLFNPLGSTIGSATLTLYNVTNISGTITIGGTSVNVSITTPGQNASYTFSGTSGQQVSLTITNVTIPECDLTVSILTPSGTTLASASCIIPPNGGFIDTVTLPVTGTYTILFNPLGAYTGSATLTLYNVTNISGTITIGGTSVNVSITTPGQNASYTFSGTSGQQVSLHLTNVTIPECDLTVSILTPSGTTLASASCIIPPNGSIPSQSLPATGTYTVLVNPTSSYTGSLTLALTSP
jgi:hypothetical protein